MKLLIDLSGFAPCKAYGATTFTKYVIEAFDRQVALRPDFEFVLLGARPALSFFTHLKHCQTFEISGSINPFIRVFQQRISFRSYEEEVRPDAIFFPLNLSQNTKAKSILYVHDLVSKFYLERHKGFKTFRNLAIWLAVKKSIKRSDVVLCPSEFIKNEIQSKVKASGLVEVLREGMPKLKLKTYYLPKSDQIKFLVSSFRAEHKNIGILIEALRLLNEEDSDLVSNFQFILTGKNDDVAQTFECKLKAINSKIKVLITGFLSNEQVYDLHTKIDAVVYCTTYEGFGLPMLEAIKFGKPIICSSIPPLLELKSEYSLFFANNSAKEMAEKLSGVRDFKVGNEPNEFLSEFSWDHFVEVIIKKAIE